MFLNLFPSLTKSAAEVILLCLPPPHPRRTQLGCDSECRQRRSPCQLLSQSQQTGVFITAVWDQFLVSVQNMDAGLCVVGQIQVGVEFEASTRTQETTTSFGYQMELPEANMVFRGHFIFFFQILFHILVQKF